MKKFLKNKLGYILTFIIISLIFIVLFYVKGIFPFGENTVVYGDMHDQITAFFYHFYDVFHGNKSLLVDYTTSGGINFIGILAYYVLSPVSLILLFFKRENIYLAVSLVVAIKIILSSLTCYYSLKVLFKDKLNMYLSIALAISYAMCGYSLLLYQITSWMDLLYLFPLIVVGLKRTLDLGKPYLYIISLTFAIIFSFYLSYMMLIFIFFLAIFYIYNFIKKEDRKKSITALGITTIISCLLSCFIALPALYQVSISSRLGFSWVKLLNSGFGPITDKLEFFLLSSFLVFPSILLIFKFRKNKSFLKWYLPSILILVIPYFVEPINKIVHFMSYAFFPNRYGFITFYVLTIGAGYYFSSKEDKVRRVPLSKIISILLVFLMFLSVFIIAYLNYYDFQISMFTLTISRYKKLFFIVLLMSFIEILVLLIVRLINSKKSRFYQVLMLISSIFIVSVNATLCIGLTDYINVVNEPYLLLNDLKKAHNDDDFYRIKNSSSSMVTNNGMVTDFYNLDHFTSLTDEGALRTLKKFGYSTYWTKTSSKNSTLFVDLLMGSKYFITRNIINYDFYKNRVPFYNHYMYELDMDTSFGYFTRNVDIYDYDDAFMLQNAIYKAISNSKDDLFTIYDDYLLDNIQMIKNDNGIKLNIVDPSKDSYITYSLKAKDESIYYFELFTSLENTDDNVLYGAMDIYVNDKLLRDKFPLTVNNGIFNLKVYENEDVNVKIRLRKDISITSFNVASVRVSDLIDFAKDNKVNTKVEYNRNKIKVNINSENDGLLFLPINYSDTYTVYIDGIKGEVQEVYNNFLGVELSKGNHEVIFTYIPPYLRECSIISVVSLLITFILFKFRIYDRLLSCDRFTKLISGIYLFVYALAIVLIYIIPFIFFIVSYIL